jgi:multidrug transporter EmrE-like cation transporter
MPEVLLALFGITIYSAGVILQKRGSGWMVWKERINRRFALTFSVWLTGMLFSYAVSTFPIGIASKSLPPHIISAVTGWSIVVVVFLSSLFLREKLHVSDIIYSIVIVGCIVLMSSFRQASEDWHMDMRNLYLLLVLPFLLLIPVPLKLTGKKQKAILLSIFSGFLGGLTIVFMNILVKESGGSIENIVGSVHLYIYFAAGAASVAAKQAAYRLGDVILVTPLQTAFSMIYPLLCSYLLCDTSIAPAQILLLLFIVLACWGIQRKR